MDLGRKMSRAEFNLLTEQQRKERFRIQQKKYRDANKDKRKKYREANKDKAKEYREVNKAKDKEYQKEYREVNKDKAKEYRENNKETLSKKAKEYREVNKEKITKQIKEYNQTPKGKQVNTLISWKAVGLQESPEDLDRIYDLWKNQELCNACDCVLTRDGIRCSTQACMDHDHDTNRFRHIICRSCNIKDSWKTHFC